MAYSQQELEDYWSGVNDGSVMSNAAPNSFQGSETFSADQTGDLQDIRDTSYADRQAAMDFSDKYQQDPEQAQLLSDRLSGVLASDSPYLQRARTKATEAAGGRGLLNSSMASGAAEGAAIDRGLQVAKGDVDVDKFNVGATNQAQQDRYNVSSDFAGQTQNFQNELGGEEARHIFGVDKEDQQQEHKLEFEEEEQRNRLEKLAAEHGNNMEKDAFKFTSDKALKMLEQNSDLYNHYLSAYGQIAMADISRSDKDAQLKKLYDQVKWAAGNNNTYRQIKITGNNVPTYNITG